MSTLNWEISLRRIGKRIMLKSIECNWRKKNHCSLYSWRVRKLTTNQLLTFLVRFISDVLEETKSISSWFLLGWKGFAIFSRGLAKHRCFFGFQGLPFPRSKRSLCRQRVVYNLHQPYAKALQNRLSSAGCGLQHSCLSLTFNVIL